MVKRIGKEMKNIVVCEDGEKEAERIQEILQDAQGFFEEEVEIFLYTEGKKLIKDCESGNLTPDLVFMDIELPDISGIEVSKKINRLVPYCYIVYVTNHIDYVTDVYSTEHQYYVLKKELKERLPQIREKIWKMEQEHNDTIMIPIKNKKQKMVHKENIEYMERKGRVTHIHIKDQDNVETPLKLDDLEMILGSHFVRCHNSFIISMRHIDFYKRERVKMDDGEEISISRKYQPYVRERFIRWSKEFLGGGKEGRVKYDDF